MSAGRIASRAKPVIAKGGRSAACQSGASHTGALAGADAVYDAVFRRAGMLRVGTLRELFDAAETLASGLHVDGGQLMVLTNGGASAFSQLTLWIERLSRLSDHAIDRLDAVLPASWPRANPVDILGDAQGQRWPRRAGDLPSISPALTGCWS